MIILTTHWISNIFSSQSGNVGNICKSKFYQNKSYLCLVLEKWVIFDISNKWGNFFFWLVCFILCLIIKQISAFVAPLISVFLFTPESCIFCGSCIFSCHVAMHIGVACIKKHTNKRNNNITLKFPFLMHHFTLLYPAHCYPTHVT